MSICRRRWSWVNSDGLRIENEGWELKLSLRHPVLGEAKCRKTFKTKGDAERYEREFTRSVYDGTWFGAPAPGAAPLPAPKTVTIREYERTFLEASEKLSGNKHSTLVSKKQLLRDHLIPFFGDTQVNAVTQKMLDEYKLSRLKPPLCLSPKTINNSMTVLQNMLKLALTHGLTDKTPQVVWLKVPKPAFDYLDAKEGEVQRLIAGADLAWRPMITLALYTGMRLGELLALRWANVNLQARRVLVTERVWRGVLGSPKGNINRECPLVSASADALKARLLEASGPYVFHTEGRMLTPGLCKWPLYRAASSAKLPRVGWHVLRHTFASTLVSAGVPLATVQVLMGHTTLAMTQKYAHLSPHARREGIDVLDGGLTAASESALSPQVPELPLLPP